MTEIHICGDKVWRGAETRAMLCAQAADSSLVVCDDAKEVRSRFERAGIPVMTCSLSGAFAPLSLSRVMRHLPDGKCEVFVHSPELRPAVEKALKIAGRADIALSSEPPTPAYPTPEVEKGSHNSFVWVGRITPDCGLNRLIEAFARLDAPSKSLRIIGQGDARHVMPLVNRTRALDINKMIEWTGYVADIYPRLNGAGRAVVTSAKGARSTVAAEFAAVGLPILYLSETNPDL